MKRILSVTAFLLIAILAIAQQETTQFMRQLMALPGISDVQPLQSRSFKEKYVMKIQQNATTQRKAHSDKEYSYVCAT